MSGERKASENLREVRLSIINQDQCTMLMNRTKIKFKLVIFAESSFNTLGNQNCSSQSEMCAGKINNRTVGKAVVKVDPNKALNHIEIKKEVSVLETVIGGQDSCLGDSGGPLWRVLGTS